MQKIEKTVRNHETHILGYENMANSKYLEIHNEVATIVYLRILKNRRMPLKLTVPYFRYVPYTVIETETIKLGQGNQILKQRLFSTDRTHNINKKEKQVFPIDVSNPNNHNVETKRNEKLQKYNSFKREIKQMWKWTP